MSAIPKESPVFYMSMWFLHFVCPYLSINPVRNLLTQTIGLGNQFDCVIALFEGRSVFIESNP